MRTNVLPFTVTACLIASGCISVPVATTVLSGQVNDEFGAHLPASTVCLSGTQTCAITDSGGNYTLSWESDGNVATTLTVSKPGYAKQNRIVNASAPVTAILLRAVAQEVTVTLPETGGAPAVVTLTRDDASVTLSIPANTLMVDATKQPVVGAIDVAMTFWHPTQRMASAPADLVAENPNGEGAPLPLTSLGMAQLELTQNGQKLQVVPGQRLSMSVAEPTSVRNSIALGLLGSNWPNLYSLDENSGLWHLEGAFDSELLTYDAQSGSFNAKLPHLSSWNVDVTGEPSAPSCVQGNVTCLGGGTASNANVKVWLMGFEMLKYLPAKSDVNGHYCADVAFSSLGSQRTQDVRYFVSGPNYTDTSMLDDGTQNPYPASCFNCSPYAFVQSGDFSYAWCTDCACNDCVDADTAATGVGNVYASFYPTTGSAHAALLGNTSCAQNNCVNLVDVAISCTGNGTNFCAGSGARHLGQSCTKTEECCPGAGEPALTCSDYLCVPGLDK